MGILSTIVCLASSAVAELLVLPGWLVSLQVGAALVDHSVNEIRRDLVPSVATELDDEQWNARIVVRVRELVRVRFNALRAWEFSFVALCAGCWATAVGNYLEPNGSTTRKALSLAFALVPLVVGLTPANVTESCKGLRRDLNNLSFESDVDMQCAGAKDSACGLRDALSALNRGAGLSFVALQVGGFYLIVSRASLKSLAVLGFTAYQSVTMLPELLAALGGNSNEVAGPGESVECAGAAGGRLDVGVAELAALRAVARAVLPAGATCTFDLGGA